MFNLSFSEFHRILFDIQHALYFIIAAEKEDVERLERIKILRTLGISIAEIKQLNKGAIQLADAVENRLTQIHEEEQKLLEICQVCEFILQNLQESI